MMRWGLLPLFVPLLNCCFHTGDAATVEIVLARCREDTSWISQLGYDGITLSYDKCDNSEGPGTHVPLPNLGREGGTFLQHIVNRYETLADWTVFSQAERPTYGYRGHRLGGGHLMNNVRFQDYVDAVTDRAARPFYFIFTNALVMTDEHMHQCVRQHYGEDYNKPQQMDTSLHMCGRPEDWQKWYTFPAWFQSMINDLLHDQGMPITKLTSKDIQQLFDVDVDYGVTFFAQGARFAASREAIHSKPKAYYHALLKYMDKPDPWAGYILEWVWWYVLGGASAPCGFEASVLQSFQQWAQEPSRHMVTLQASGISGNNTGNVTGNGTNTSNVVFSGNNVVSKNIVAGCSKDVEFQSASETTFTANTSITNGNCPGQVTLNQATWMLLNDVTVAMATTMFNSAVALTSTASLTLSSPTGTTNTITKTTITCQSKANTINVNSNTVSTNVTIVICTILVTPQTTTTSRRTGYTTMTFCGTDASDVTVKTGSAAEMELNCTLATGTYSNSLNSLTYAAGSLLVLSSVTRNSLPTLISSWSSPAGMPVAVTTSDTGTFSTEVVRYQTNGTCATSWSSVTFDNCPSGLTCSLTGSTDPTNTSYCRMVYTQASSGNNNALLGLIALVALVPLLALAGLGAWWFMKSKGAAADVAPQEYYPTEAYAVYPEDVPPTPYGYYLAEGNSVAYQMGDGYLAEPGEMYLNNTPAASTAYLPPGTSLYPPASSAYLPPGTSLYMS